MSEHAESPLKTENNLPLTEEQVRQLKEIWSSNFGKISHGPLMPVPFDAGKSVFESILEEQQKTNQLLLMLIQALAEEQNDMQEPITYMDGSSV